MVKVFSIGFWVLCASCSMLVDEKNEVEDAGYSTSSAPSTEIVGTSVETSDSSNDTLENSDSATYSDSATFSDSLTYSDTVSATTQDDTGSVSDTYIVHDTETTTYPECDPSFGPCCDETGHFRGKDFVCDTDARWLTCDKPCGKIIQSFKATMYCTGISSFCIASSVNSGVSPDNVEVGDFVGGVGCTSFGEKCADSSWNVFGNDYTDTENWSMCKYFVDTSNENCGPNT